MSDGVTRGFHFRFETSLGVPGRTRDGWGGWSDGKDPRKRGRRVRYTSLWDKITALPFGLSLYSDEQVGQGTTTWGPTKVKNDSVRFYFTCMKEFVTVSQTEPTYVLFSTTEIPMDVTGKIYLLCLFDVGTETWVSETYTTKETDLRCGGRRDSPFTTKGSFQKILDSVGAHRTSRGRTVSWGKWQLGDERQIRPPRSSRPDQGRTWDVRGVYTEGQNVYHPRVFNRPFTYWYFLFFYFKK